MLSLEYWGEKIGSLLDGPPPPPETELVEDPVVKAQFETTQGNLQSDYEQASSRLHSVENHRESIMQRINELEKANRQTSLEYEQAKEEARQAQVEMKKANDRKMLSQWKQEMLSKVRGLLFSHQSEMLQPVLSSLHTFCLKCRDEAKSVLAQRMDATVTQVKDELEKKKSLFAASQSELEPRIKLQQEQVRCLNELLDADENLWAQ